MEYVFAVFLTLWLAIGIIMLISKMGNISASKIIPSQSETHNIIKDYIPRPEKKVIVSQLQKHLEQNSIRIVLIDNKAYWVNNNIFYSAELVNNIPDFPNAEPVDTINMSKTDLDKMILILDNLREGVRDDNSGTGY